MQQESLQGKFHGRLSGLATIPAAQDEVPVNAVLKELCNMVSKLVPTCPKHTGSLPENRLRLCELD